MGVRGLLSFINSRHEEYFIPINLSGCKIVVDGNNLRYCLYNNCPVRNSCFGGDYQKYYLHVKAYFKKLLECRMDPIVLMDGSFETAKKPTLYSRAKDQARTSVACFPSTHHKNIVLPMFAKEIFLQAIRDLEIQIVQTLSEADAEIARLGYRTTTSSKKCFVISNDTDFCIYDVNVISLDSTLSADVINIVDKKCLTCRQFDRTKFLSLFKIGPEKSGLLHLMATLCGNDYVGKTGGALDRIFGQVPKVPKASRKSMSPRHQRMFALLTWLAKEDDTEKALQRLLEAVPKDKREVIKEKLQSSIEIYNLDKEDLDEFTTFGDRPLSRDFICRYKDAFFPHWVLDVCKHRLSFLPNQVEDQTRISSHQLSGPIFEKICQIMVAQDLGASENSEEAIVVQMVARGKLSSVTRRFTFRPQRDIFSYDELQKLDSAQRESIFYSSLDIKDKTEQNILSEQRHLAVIFLSLHFWLSKSNESQEPVSALELNAILTSLAVSQISNTESSKSLTEKFYELGRMSRDTKNPFDISVVHTLANFQAVLYHASVLNRLLGNPFPDPVTMNKWWNGTLMFNLASGNHFKDEKELRSKLLSLDLKCLANLDLFSDKIRRAVSASSRLRTTSNIKSRNRRRNRQKLERKEESDGEEIESSGERETEKDSSETFCDINNRFAMLLSQ